MHFFTVFANSPISTFYKGRYIREELVTTFVQIFFLDGYALGSAKRSCQICNFHYGSRHSYIFHQLAWPKIDRSQRTNIRQCVSIITTKKNHFSD